MRRAHGTDRTTATREIHLRDRRRRLVARQGPGGRLDRLPARGPRLQDRPPEVRSVHQRRSGHDEPVPARRGLRHRRRRGDRPRPRATTSASPTWWPRATTTGRPARSTCRSSRRSAAATTWAARSRSFRTSRTRSRTAIRSAAQDVDVLLVEIGGTVGDIESLPFLEAIRQFRQDVGRENTLYIHLTLVPYIASAGELKTKPTQHSVRDLRSIGIQPDVLLCRTDRPLEQDMKRKIALFCDVDEEAVITARDVSSIYEVPLNLAGEGLDRILLNRLHLPETEAQMDDWQDLVERIQQPEGRDHDPLRRQVRRVRGLVQEHQRGALPRRLPPPAEGQPEVRRGRGARAAGRPGAARRRGRHPGRAGVWRPRQPRHDGRRRVRADTDEIPYFGICYGFQWAVVEFARNVAGLDGRRLDRGHRGRAAQGHLQAARPARRRRHGRHDAARQLRLPAGARLAGLPALRRGNHPRAPSPPLRVQLPVRDSRSPSTACGSSAGRSTASSSRSSSCPAIRGIWRSSSIRSSSRSRCARIRCSPGSSRRPTSGKMARQGIATNVTAIGDRRASGVPASCDRRPCPTSLPRDGPQVPIADGVVLGATVLVLIAGPCVIESEAHAVGLGRGDCRHRAARRRAVRLQGLVRQGQPHVGARRSAARASRPAWQMLARVEREVGVPILTDIHEPWQAAQVGRGRRRPADSGVPLAADRPDRRGGEDRARRQPQEGPVPGAARHAARDREGAVDRATTACS